MARLHPERGTWLPFILVLISLISAIVLPRLAENRVTALRDEINDVADPARLRVTDILLDMALQASQRRGYLLSDDTYLGREYAASRTRRIQSEQELLAYARQLDGSNPGTLTPRVEHLRQLTAQLDSLVAMHAPASAPSYDAQRHVFVRTRQLADTLGAEIDSIAIMRRATIDRTENSTRLLTAALVLLGLGAAFVVAQLGSGYRDLLARERVAREAAVQRRTELERVTESRGRLLRGFTHDVKNPLSAADGYLALLEDGVFGDLDDRQRKSIVRARRSITNALELIARLLELARAEAGQLELRWQAINIFDDVRDVADAFAPQARAKGVGLDVKLRPDLPPIETDSARLRQVVGNLVSNAVKYTPAGGHVVVDASLCGDGAKRAPEIAVSVSDDGPGMTEDQLQRVFMEFTRFDPNAAEGAGVGLAISQKIAEALGGKITVESRVGVGSTFVLHVPVDRRGGADHAVPVRSDGVPKG